MRYASNDTIAAVATPAGKGGIGIIRVSGLSAEPLLRQIIGKTITPRRACFTCFFDHDRQVIDEGIVLWFKGPASFTGEDLFELHAHGSPVVLDLLLQTLIKAGARLAQPGEFSRRAFENNKYDLSQLEAVSELIHSTGVQAARSAQRVLQGEFSARIHAVVSALRHLRVSVEAAIDFADEDIEHATTKDWQAQLQTTCDQLTQLQQSATEGARLSAGAQVVIIGCPNVGKSSLLNRLAQCDAAIVSDIAGTTRDVLTTAISVRGLTLSIMDTAGLRDKKAVTGDPIEREGMRRARAAMATADAALIVIDASIDYCGQERTLANDLSASDVPCLWVLNKIDLITPTQRTALLEKVKTCTVLVSAKTGAGIGELGQRLIKELGLTDSCEDTLIARRRHLIALNQAATHLREAKGVVSSNELFAEELRLAQTALEIITGETSNEDLLEEIFATFCIGK